MAAVKEFSVQERLESLIRLQKIDSSIDEINKLRGELPMEVKDLEDELEGYNTRLSHIDNEIVSIEGFIKQKDLDQKTAKEMLKKYEKQQNNVKNSREFEAINKEVELQDLEIKACEKHIKDAKIEIAERQAQRKNTEALIADKNEILETKKEELKKISEETAKEEAQLSKRRNSAEEHVEQRLLLAYNRIRSNYKNGLAVVSVERNSCGGCYNVIPPQRQSEIRLRKKMIVCEHCGRIMVDSELNETVAV